MAPSKPRGNEKGMDVASDTIQPRQDSPREPQGASDHADLASGQWSSGALFERGLTTVEYAMGIVLVLSIVGVLITATSQGWFVTLVKGVVQAVFRAITSGMGG